MFKNPLSGSLGAARCLAQFAFFLILVAVAVGIKTPAFAQTAAESKPSALRDVQFALSEVLKTRDHRGLPFAIVDKTNAQLFVFDGSGQLKGSTPALMGLTPGDIDLAPVADGNVQSLSATQRTTPAGRFVSEPGHNLTGDAVVWVDYAARLAIHRLRPAPAHERRPERLASSTPDDNRITLGCVVVAPLFYDTVVLPTLGKGYGVVYVLPENDRVQRLHAILH